MRPGSIHESLSGRELLSLLYRLARHDATGLIEVARPNARGHTMALCRGQLVVSARGDAREVAGILRRFAAEPRLRARFDAGVTAYPPGDVSGRRLALDAWVVAFLEGSLTGAAARELYTNLAGVRVRAVVELAPDPRHLDDTGQRILAALGDWRRAEELATMARAPRFRTLAFLFALRSLGALEEAGVATRRLRTGADGDGDARRVLGLAKTADRAAVKRAYRRLARALHPDLRPAHPHRRALETRLAAINRAYRVLLRDNP